MRNVVFAAPFPHAATMRFARAAARLPGVRMLGICQELPQGPDAHMFAALARVNDGLDTGELIAAARRLASAYGPIHRVLGILEPLQVPLAECRRALGVRGTDPATADLFRDKSRMKDELRRHGLPCARHRLVRSWPEAEAFAQEVGFPLILKPPAGMGSRNTWRVKDADQLGAALRASRMSAERPALAEEFLRGSEHSFETITVGGEVRFASASHYDPSCIEVVENPWIKWVVVLPQEQDDDPELVEARALAIRAVEALGLETGFTHMEWFKKDDGSLAIGEIAARPPGAHLVLANSYAHDADLYRAWARAVVDDAFDGPWRRKYAVGVAYLRGGGAGRRVSRVLGVEEAQRRVGELVVEVRLPARGSPRADSYEGEGFVMVRHPDTATVRRAMSAVIETIQVEYE
jgi:formate-dependent phosphoribosylglycinamide formyltransferase (GAR transformylase)